MRGLRPPPLPLTSNVARPPSRNSLAHAFTRPVNLQFGWASGALATTFLTDYAQPADEEQIWSVWEGNARVKR